MDAGLRGLLCLCMGVHGQVTHHIWAFELLQSSEQVLNHIMLSLHLQLPRFNPFFMADSVAKVVFEGSFKVKAGQRSTSPG